MNLSVVEDCIGGDCLFDGGWVSGWVNAIGLSKCGEFCVCAQTVGDWFGEVSDELFAESDYVEEVAHWASCCFGKDFSSEFNNFMSSLIIKAVDNSSGSFEFVLIKKSIEALLHDFFVSEGMSDDKQSEKC